MNKKAKVGIGVILIIGLIVFFLFVSKDKVDETQQELGGVEIYFTDVPSDEVDAVDLVIERIELVGDKGTITMAVQTQVRLKEALIQKVAGDTIPEDNYRVVRVYLPSVAMVAMKNGQSEQITVTNRVISLTIDRQVADGQILTLIIDIPLEDSIEEENGDLVFGPQNTRLELNVRQQIGLRISEQVRSRINERVQLPIGEIPNPADIHAKFR